MGIAERFKNRLERSNIFETSAEIPKVSRNVSVPITGVSPKFQIYRYENLEAQIISKIRNTPYWNDYTREAKENMISSYFYKKADLTSSNVSEQDCRDFVQNVIDLT